MFKEWDSCLKGTEKIASLDCVPIVFENLVRAALMFAGVIALIFIILSGIKMITSGGDPKAIGAAKQTLTFAIIGLVIILFSFLIISTIGYITGTQCISSFGFDTCK